MMTHATRAMPKPGSGMGPVYVAGCDGLRSVKGGMPDGVLKILRDAGLLR